MKLNKFQNCFAGGKSCNCTLSSSESEPSSILNDGVSRQLQLVKMEINLSGRTCHQTRPILINLHEWRNEKEIIILQIHILAKLLACHTVCVCVSSCLHVLHICLPPPLYFCIPNPKKVEAESQNVTGITDITVKKKWQAG